MTDLFIRCETCSTDHHPSRCSVRPGDAAKALDSTDTRLVAGTLLCTNCDWLTVVWLSPARGRDGAETIDRLLLRVIAEGEDGMVAA